MDQSLNSSFDVSDNEKNKNSLSSTRTVSESEECIIFQQLDVFANGFSVMEEIRRQGKLCDVTLKVHDHWILL